MANWIAEHAVTDLATQNRLKTHLVVSHDDDFTHFVRHATEVVARVGLDYAKRDGQARSLFYQEYLPIRDDCSTPVLLANDGRRQDYTMSADEVITYVNTHVPRVLQIGGERNHRQRSVRRAAHGQHCSSKTTPRKASHDLSDRHLAATLETMRAKACLGGRKQHVVQKRCKSGTEEDKDKADGTLKAARRSSLT